jgi:hypothetical protein
MHGSQPACGWKPIILVVESILHDDAELLETIGVERTSSRRTGETVPVRGASRGARESGVLANETRSCRICRHGAVASPSHLLLPA